MPTTQIKIATLHPDMIARYEQLHNEIPEQNLRHMREGGYCALRIFRHGTTLVMLAEFDEALMVSDRVVDEAAEVDWYQKTSECFATPWTDAPEIFRFATTIGVEDAN